MQLAAFDNFAEEIKPTLDFDIATVGKVEVDVPAPFAESLDLDKPVIAFLYCELGLGCKLIEKRAASSCSGL